MDTGINSMGAFNQEYGTDAAQKQIDLINKEIGNLCMIIGGGGGSNDNETRCFGFKFGGNEWGIIIHEDKQDNETRIAVKEIILTLIENVRMNCKVTISIGFTNYDEDKDESFEEWNIRANNFLKQAKTNGKNCACWGQDIKSLKRRAMSTTDIIALANNKDIDDNKEDDLITTQSLQEIAVCLFFSFLLFFLLLFFTNVDHFCFCLVFFVFFAPSDRVSFCSFVRSLFFVF